MSPAFEHNGAERGDVQAKGLEIGWIRRLYPPGCDDHGDAAKPDAGAWTQFGGAASGDAAAADDEPIGQAQHFHGGGDSAAMAIGILFVQDYIDQGACTCGMAFGGNCCSQQVFDMYNTAMVRRMPVTRLTLPSCALVQGW